MFRNSSTKIILVLLTFTQILFLVSCNPQVLDDFFGIQMDPQYSDSFEIVSYSAQEGAKYKSNMFMNPLVYAFAEFKPNSIHIKIVNIDSSPLKVNYNLDKFFLYTDDDKLTLTKGDRERYSVKKEIRTNDSFELDLELPTNFSDTIGMTSPQSHNSNYTIDFWKGENTLNIVKEKVKYIEVNLGSDIVIILKPTP